MASVRKLKKAHQIKTANKLAINKDFKLQTENAKCILAGWLNIPVSILFNSSSDTIAK